MDGDLNPRWKGCRVELKLKNRSPVTGTVSLVGKGALTLRDVSVEGNEIPHARFEKHDIVFVNIITPCEVSSSDSSGISSPPPLERFRAQDLPRQVCLRERAVQPKEVPAHLRGAVNTIDVNVLTNRVPLPVQSGTNGNLEAGNGANVPEFDADYVFIDSVDDSLCRAVEHIQSLNEIAVSLIGENISSRHGTPILLNIAAGDYVFLFDLLSLGKAAFTTGEGVTLKDILESEDVTKIAHNCQGMSDILRSLYQVELTKVDDTLAFAASEVYMRVGGFSKFVLALPFLLHKILNVPKSHIYFPRNRAGMNDESIWRERPLPEHLLLSACKTVVHLISLRDELVSLHLARARAGSRILLNHMRSKQDDQAAMSCVDVENLMPLQFLSLDDIRCKPRSERKFEETADGTSVDPYVHYTRDTQKLSRQTRSAVSLHEYNRSYR